MENNSYNEILELFLKAVESVKSSNSDAYTEDDEDFEDNGYGEGFDPDEAYGEPEYLSEDDFDDRINNEHEDSE